MSSSDDSSSQSSGRDSQRSSSLLETVKEYWNLFLVVFIQPIISFVSNLLQPTTSLDSEQQQKKETGHDDTDVSASEKSVKKQESMPSTPPPLYKKAIVMNSLNMNSLNSLASPTSSSSSMGALSTHTPRGSKRILVGEENQKNMAQQVRESMMQLENTISNAKLERVLSRDLSQIDVSTFTNEDVSLDELKHEKPVRHGTRIEETKMISPRASPRISLSGTSDRHLSMAKEIERIQVESSDELNLSNLGLSIFPHKLYMLGRNDLKAIDLSDNRLTSLSAEFTNTFRTVERLILKKNLFTSMFNEFTRMPRLRVLDLSFNRFEILPQTVLQCVSLRELYLNNNSLIALQPDIAKLENLEVLDISNNLLSKLPDELADLKNLKKLNVSNNNYIDSAMKTIMQLYQKNPKLERDIKLEDVSSMDIEDQLKTTKTSSQILNVSTAPLFDTPKKEEPEKVVESKTPTKNPEVTVTSPPTTTSPPQQVSNKHSPSMNIVKSLKKDDEKRVYTILEVLESEFKYKNYLEVLFNEFILPISNCDDRNQQGYLQFTDCGIPDGKQFVKKIFPPDLENILKCSQMFYRDLSKRIISDTGDAEKQKQHIYECSVGDLFLMYIPFFKVYIDYQSHYSRTVHQNLPNAYKEYPKFKEVIELAKTVEGTDGLDISSLLIMPCQRIVKLCLLIKAIIKETPNTHPDYPKLEMAATKMQSTAHEINRKMKDIANLRKLIDIASQYSVDGLVISTRRFISSTPVKLYTGSNREALRERVKIHVFNDSILFTEDQHYITGFLLGYPSELYKFTEFEIDNSAQEQEEVALKIKPKNQTYHLICESDSEKNTLVQQIKDASKQA